MKKRIVGLLAVMVLVAVMFMAPTHEAVADVTVDDLTATVSTGTITARSVSLHLVLVDSALPAEEQTVIDADFSESYTLDDGLSVAVRNSIAMKMQKAVDDYKKLKVLREGAGYQAAAGVIEGQLNL